MVFFGTLLGYSILGSCQLKFFSAGVLLVLPLNFERHAFHERENSMSMETASFILLGLGVVAFFFTRNSSPTKTAASWAVFLMGAGVGLFVGAVWAAMIIRDAFGF